jgi:Kef-type K+ transport system membrane component KefB
MSVSDVRRESGRGRALTVPLTAVVIGLCYLVAGVVGGQTWFGVFGLSLMLAIGALFWVGSNRSETVAALSDGHDERINVLNNQASLLAGNDVLVACLVMFVVRLAEGRDAQPYTWLAALGGVSYAAALVWRLLRG